MTVKITAPNNGSDSLDIQNASGLTLAQFKGYDDGSFNSHLELYTTAGGVSTEQVRVTSAGNVGIGTTSPAHQLDVANGARARYVQILNNGYAGSAATTPELYSPAAATLAFGAGGAERMRIDSSGNLLVGTTSSPSASQKGIKLSYDLTSAASASSVGSVTTLSNHMYFINGNGAVGTISTSGTATTYATSSDYRLKENVQPMVGALDTVAQLKPVTYDWIADKSKGQGFIAHELQAVVPDCVTGEKDAVDADGNPVYQGIDTSFLVGTLTAAIQELKAIVDAQAQKIQALEAK